MSRKPETTRPRPIAPRPVDAELMDDELRRMCESYGPVADEYQPRGLPAEHWWWRCTGADAAA